MRGHWLKQTDAGPVAVPEGEVIDIGHSYRPIIPMKLTQSYISLKMTNLSE
jgi:hypothetical protein